MIDRFAGLDDRTLNWLRLEQTLNERIINTRVLVPIDHGSSTVRPAMQPERQPTWRQEVVWLPPGLARRYGPVKEGLAEAFGLRVPARRTPLFLHAQAPRSHRRLAGEFGAAFVDGVCATPTASVRSVVAWQPDGRRDPVVLKLSIGAVIAKVNRALREGQVARAVVITSLLETIPRAHRRALGLDWFPEPAGVAETASETGWLLRRFPAMLSEPSAGALVPAFSLISRGTGAVPLLVTLIRRARRRAEAFVIDEILRPYVRALAYLLFEQGLQYEGHSQNVLLEFDRGQVLTGRLVLRDLSDTTVNLAYRIARRLPLPRLADRPRSRPFALGTNAADYVSNFGRPKIHRSYDTVERYGLWGFVWPLNTSLARFIPGYDAVKVEDAYLDLWQRAAVFYTNVTPLARRRPKGIATDETVAYYLRHTDWKGLGAVPAALPAAAEALKIEGRARRRGGRVYDRVECAWGDLYVYRGFPEFFRAGY